MLAYILRRVFQSAIVLLVVGLVAFALFRFVGDPIDNLLGQERTIEDFERLREQLGLPESAEGLVVADVAEDSEAYEEGLRAGDIITEAGQEDVSTVGDLEDRIAEAKEAGRKSILLLVSRGGDRRFVALGIDNS